MANKVYFMDDRYSGLPSSLPAKAQQLFDEANLEGCFESGDSVAIKCHMGEWYNSAYLRPILVRESPQVTTMLLLRDSSSMACARVSTSLSATSTVSSSLKEGFMAKAIADADSMIVVSHFKGHGSGVYGGSIKNIAIGCSSKRGKLNVHLTTHPEVGWTTWSFEGENCVGQKCPDATVCDNMCPVHAMKVKEDRMEWDREACIGCFGHQRPFFRCNVWGREKYEEFRTWFLIAMGDAATGYVRHLGPENVGFISYAIDITPACDCVPGSDRPVLPNLGVLASRDMVAIDIASLDLADKAPGIPGSMAEEKEVMDPGAEKFTGIVGMSQWVTANAAAGRGVGSKEYELIEPPVSDDEAAFCFPAFSPERPSGYYLGKGVAKFGTWIPEGGFKYNKAPLKSFETLSSR
jgi:uncharacterized Fe-S center protein